MYLYRRSLQWAAVILVRGFPICVVFEKNPSNLYVPTIRGQMQWTAFIIVPGIYIRAMLEEQLNDIHTSVARCHM
jgi:hypothetical protein